MSKDLENFFNSQFDEHNRVASNCQKKLQSSFLKIIKICLKSLKRKKKILLNSKIISKMMLFLLKA